METDNSKMRIFFFLLCGIPVIQTSKKNWQWTRFIKSLVWKFNSKGASIYNGGKSYKM